MKIKRWMILTTVFVVLASSIIVSGCQTSNTASTSGGAETTNCTACNDCKYGEKSYNCNDPNQCADYMCACTVDGLQNFEYNGKIYDCTNPIACFTYWCTWTCDACMQKEQNW